MERIADVGYINEECKHLLISIFNPALLNPSPDSVQVAITIESAIELRNKLVEFLQRHNNVYH